MHISPILSLYIGRQFLIAIAAVFLVFVATIFLFDAVELVRRSSGPDQSVPVSLLLQMALLRIPMLAQEALPFAALVGGIVTFTRMTRSSELVIARSAGVSAWQFLLPPLLLAIVIGGISMTVINPFASTMVSRYEHMEATVLEGKSSLLELKKTGIWLRQGDRDGHSVVQADRLEQETLTLHNVTIFLYKENDQFVGRIDADHARLTEGAWEISDALLTSPDGPAERLPHHRIQTDLTFERIQDSFSPPETLSFWALPGFIKVLEDSGFSAVRHRLHWHSLLAGPLLLCAMVLIAATFSLRFYRRGGTLLLVVAAVVTGFLLYFVSDLVLALGMSGKIPPVLAAWTPVGTFLLLGVASLFHLEDG